MNGFNLSERIPLVPELRLERYHQLGYDISVRREPEEENPFRSLVIVSLESKKDGYFCEITFNSELDADRWNRGEDVKPKKVNQRKTTLAFVVEPIIVSKHLKKEPEPERSTIEGPRRLIEV